jgi:hypothetical protein
MMKTVVLSSEHHDPSVRSAGKKLRDLLSESITLLQKLLGDCITKSQLKSELEKCGKVFHKNAIWSSLVKDLYKKLTGDYIPMLTDGEEALN